MDPELCLGSDEGVRVEQAIVREKSVVGRFIGRVRMALRPSAKVVFIPKNEITAEVVHDLTERAIATGDMVDQRAVFLAASAYQDQQELVELGILDVV